MELGTTELFSSGFETASLVASSGLLSSPWNLIAHLTAETHPNQNLFWKKLSNNGSDLTIIAFGTTLKRVQPDLVRSTDMRDNPFEFLCSTENPNFSLDKSAVSLFNDHSQRLDQLKSEIDLKKPVIVTGHGVGGSIASLFTLWLIEKMSSSDKRPLCITFGSPLIGDKCLQEAISQSSRWNSCFLHVASHRDPLVSSFISDDSYRPFGTFLLCSDCGFTCSENPDSILRLIKEMSTLDQGFHQSQGYGNIVEKLTSQAICKDSDVPDIPQNPLQAGLALQLQELGFSNSQLLQNNLVKDLERQEVLLTLNKRQRFIPHNKLYGMKIYMAQLEWYKKSGKRRGGYYDSHKDASTPAYMDSAMVVRVLNNYWKGTVEEVDQEPLKAGVSFCKQWLYAGTSYRRMVEPLDIAHYYREGGEDYINKGRSEHYKLLQKWQEEEQKKRLEEDKRTEPLNRRINMQAILTWDSCFWAHVEEAILSLKTCNDASSNVVEKQEAMKRLEEFEEYIYGLLKNYTVSPDIFLEGSTYMRWWNDYIKFKGSSHRSSLANFMINYVMHENGQYDLAKDNTSLTSDSVKDTSGIVGKGIEYKSTRKSLEAAVKDLSPSVEKIRQPTLKGDAETLIFPEFIEGLNSELMEELKSYLMMDGGDQILNLHGLIGMGKTTLALQLCADPHVQGCFHGNVTFVSVESNRESNRERLGIELREKWNDRKGLLVLDNVESGVEDLVQHCLRQLPSNSKILAISRVVLPELGRQVTMAPLGDQDAITLLSHYVRPIGAASYNLPDPSIVRQVLRRCGGSPMAIKMIGRDLRERQTDVWEQYLGKLSQQDAGQLQFLGQESSDPLVTNMATLSSAVFYVTKEIWKMVEKGLDHEKTAQSFGNMENDLYPMFEGIGELARKINVPEQEIESLKSVMKEMRQARLNYSETGCWNFCLAPYYKDELDKADQLIKDFIWTRLTVQTLRIVMDIRCDQIGTTDQTTHKIQQPTLKINDAETLMLSEFVEGLNTSVIEQLKSGLTTDGGDEVLNLNGLAGTGKTTLALQLCVDPQVRGWFNGNVALVLVESSSDESIIGGQLGRELCKKWNDRKGLLVLDNVEPGVEDQVGHCLRQLPSNSKILAISRVELRELGRAVTMGPLDERDATTLLSHFVRPIGAASYNLPSRSIVLQALERCGGSPMAIKMIGRDLRGKQTEFWRLYLRDESWQGHSTIRNTQSKWLDHLHHSLLVSEEYDEAISECFMDLGLFPTNTNIPVSALLDMWVQLYNQDEDGIDAMTVVHRLRDMNLADKMVKTRHEISSSDEENDVDNQFLTQHDILRELASKYSREQAGEFERKRLIIEINSEGTRPECLQQQPQRGINAYLPFLNALKQPLVAARMLSITTDQNVTPPDSCFIKAAEAQVLVLNLRTSEYRLPEFITEMKSLKVLIVTTYGFLSTQFKNFKLLGFLYELERIRLERVTVPCIWKLKKLRKLSLYECEVNRAFENSSMEFSKAMPNLEELKIEDSTDLVELPAGIWNIVNLKKLSITKCRNFTELHQEIRKLRRLELLRISYCDQFEEMPESIAELQNLTFLDISHCRMLRKLPDNIGQLQKLTNFCMAGCHNIDGLPSSIMSLTRLETVICDECTSAEWELVNDSINFDLKVQTTFSMP